MTRDYTATVRVDRRSFLTGTAAAAGSLVGLAGTASASGSALVVGTTTPGRVYRRDPDGWVPMGAALTGDLGSVTDLLMVDGTLYAAVTTHTAFTEGSGKVFRWDGSAWTQVGEDLGNNVNELVVYEGSLHAGVSVGDAELYRLDDESWTRVVHAGAWTGAGAMAVYDGALYVGDLSADIFGRYDGETFTTEANRGGSCVYDFEIYEGDLYAGAYRGKLYRRDGGDWTIVDQADAYGYLFVVAEHDGTLFVGTDFGPDLFRLEDGTLTRVKRFDETVVALFDAGDALYIGTGQNTAEFTDSYPQGTDGHLYRYVDGTIEEVSPDQDFAGAVQTMTTVGLNEPPTADIAVTTATPVTGEPIVLDGTASSDPDGEISRYEWDLDGDGTFEATGPTVEATVDEPGAHEMTLRVTDDSGATATATTTISVALGVGIEIKPPAEPTPINPRRKTGVLPVAIDGTSVDPASVAVDSIRIGAPEVVRSGTGATPVHEGHRTDATGDGTTDLVVHVPIDEAGFDGDESVGALRGETVDGTRLVGTDAVTIVGGGPPR